MNATTNTFNDKAASRTGEDAGAVGIESLIPDVSLYFFASMKHYDAQSYYKFVLEACDYADREGFAGAWFPERHFVDFGGFSPNPVVLAAAVAARTHRLRLRAGSIAAPLHHPVRIAEEWGMVDMLSRGRVGLSFASGWHHSDFILATTPHSHRKEVTTDYLNQVRALWAGHPLEYRDPDGAAHSVKLAPKPISDVLPLWLTTAGSSETYALAGRLGVGVMCALFNQTLRQLERKIELYRSAWRDAGHPGRGHVVTMVHTCISEERNLYDLLRPAMRDYLLSFSSQDAAPSDDEVLDAAVESYFDGPSLLGSAERAKQLLPKLKSADIDEIGALIDFGLPSEFVLQNLQNISRVRSELTQARGEA